MSLPALTNMPRKVIEEARSRGVHNDCLYAGATSCCVECFDIVMASYDVFYGGATTATEMMLMILDDMDEEKADAGS